MHFPLTRLRRNRQAEWVRDLTAEHNLQPSDLVQPFFVIDGENKKEEIVSLPDNYRYSIDLLIEQIKKCQQLGMKAVALFPVINNNLKDATGSEAANADNLIAKTIRSIKANGINIGIICDVALDPYTSHGHDGILNDNGEVDNDSTIEMLCQQALVLAKAGADFVAPSDMMDGRIEKIREYLDEFGFKQTGIIAYSAKYASSLYGPFRDACGSKNNLNKADKKTYQMDFRNSKEAMREIEQDVLEGADAIMVKPGSFYLDIISQASQNFNLPICAYQVSGEYAMLNLAAKHDLLDYDAAIMENLIAFKRAGAKFIFSYASIYVAERLLK